MNPQAPEEAGDRGASLIHSDKLLFRLESLQVADAEGFQHLSRPGVASWVFIAVLMGMLAAAGIFLSLSSYSRKEAASGSIEPTAGALRITGLRDGVITAVYVRDDQVVKRGQDMFALRADPTFHLGQPLSAALQAVYASEAQSLADQEAARRKSIQEQIKSQRAKSESLNAQGKILLSEIDTQRRRVQLEKSTFDQMESLHREGYISDMQYRQQQAAVFGEEESLSTITRQYQQALLDGATARIDMARLANDAKDTAAGLSAAKAQIQERVATTKADGGGVIASPSDGRILAIDAQPGDTVTRATTLAVLLPAGSSLQAVLWLPSKSIGLIRVGDRIRYSLDAFPYERFGGRRGRILSIDRAPIEHEGGQANTGSGEPLFRVVGSIDRQSMSAFGRDWPLIPGMHFSATVVVETRSLWGWLLGPVFAVHEKK